MIPIALSLLLSGAPLALSPAASLFAPRVASEEVEPLTAWPAPDRDQKSAIKKEIPRLVKDTMEGMAEDAAATLTGFGDVSGPALIDALNKAKDDDVRGRVEAVLDAVTDARHTHLLAAEFDARSGALRSWSMMRVASFPTPALRAEADAAWEATDKRIAKGKADPREPFAAAVLVSSTGSLVGLPRLFEEIQAKDVWKDDGQLVHTALGGVRGSEAAVVVRDTLLPGADRKGVIAALRLLGGCGDAETTAPVVGPYLDETDNGILIAAINALRGAVDGEPPVERLSTFEAIERARAWKERL